MGEKLKQPTNPEPVAEKPDPPFNYLQDYGPSQGPIYRRGSRATKLGLELGVITEEDIVD